MSGIRLQPQRWSAGRCRPHGRPHCRPEGRAAPHSPRNAPDEATRLLPPLEAPRDYGGHGCNEERTSEECLSFRTLVQLAGPGLIISMSYMDPGNIEADLDAGALARYKLLWVLLWSSVVALLLQRLAARLGAVTGLHLAEHCHRNYHWPARLLLWLMVELAIIGNDVQEVMGTAIALHLLTAQRLPLWAGVVITILDTLTFMLIDKLGVHKLELLFGIFLAVVSVTFGYEFLVAGPPPVQVLKGVLVPMCEGCGAAALLQILSLVGAIIAPHNLYLHSALVKERVARTSDPERLRVVNRYYFLETCIAIFMSFFINLFVVSVFGVGLYGKTNHQVRNICLASGNKEGYIFPDNSELASPNIFDGGIFLGCQYGEAATYIWAVGLLAAGQASTMNSCLTGQFIIEGFLQLNLTRWHRVLFTRAIAILPAFWVASFDRVKDLSAMNNVLNAVMSLHLPFALLPLIAFTGSVAIMGQFVNSFSSTVFFLLLSAVIISVNSCYLAEALRHASPLPVPWAVACALLGVLYISLALYLAAHMVFSIGLLPSLAENELVRRFVYSPPPEAEDPGSLAPFLQDDLHSSSSPPWAPPAPPHRLATFF